MFESFFSRLKTAKSVPLPEDDTRLAMAALLVHIAKSDHHYALEEIVQIDEVLARRYGITIVAAAKLRAQAEEAESQAPADTDFSSMITDAISKQDRREIVIAMWQIIMADGVERAQEHEIFEVSCKTLGVDSEEVGRRLGS